MSLTKTKQNLEDIFQILYDKKKVDLAVFIQELYFLIDDNYDDETYTYEEESEEEDSNSEYEEPSDSEELQFKVDDMGFYSLI